MRPVFAARSQSAGILYGFVALIGIGVYQAGTVLIAQAGSFMHNTVLKRLADGAGQAIAGAVLFGILFFFKADIKELYFIILLFMVLFMLSFIRIYYAVRVVLVMVLMVTGLWADIGRTYIYIPVFTLVVDNFDNYVRVNPLESEAPRGSAMVQMAVFARKNTPEKAMFIVPPTQSSGQFRLYAKRALVVDHKCFPYSDRQMAAWMDRMRDLYGDDRESLLPMYRKITDKKLLRLGKQYNATHAVLYKETPTKFPVLFKYNYLKMVTLPLASSFSQ